MTLWIGIGSAQKGKAAIKEQFSDEDGQKRFSQGGFARRKLVWESLSGDSGLAGRGGERKNKKILRIKK